MKILPALLLFGVVVSLSACGKQGAEAPTVRVVNVTTSTVQTRDLPVIESAVGSAVALGAVQALDPNSVRGGSFTVRLPFPEHVARQLRIGQRVRLSSFDNPPRNANAVIREIRPALDSTTQTLEVITELPDGREWYSLGSVRGEVVIGVRRGARVVPEQAIVLRPESGGAPGQAQSSAGRSISVVYVPDGDSVRQRTVRPGLVRAGEVEILDGVGAGETVVVDGAGLLTDGAKIRILPSRDSEK